MKEETVSDRDNAKQPPAPVAPTLGLVPKVMLFIVSSGLALAICKFTGHTDSVSFGVAFVSILIFGWMMLMRYMSRR